MQATIETNKQEMKANKQDSDEKMMQFRVKFKTILTVNSNKLNTLASSLTQNDTSTPPDPTTVAPDNRSYLQLEGGEIHKNWWHLDPQT